MISVFVHFKRRRFSNRIQGQLEPRTVDILDSSSFKPIQPPLQPPEVLTAVFEQEVTQGQLLEQIQEMHERKPAREQAQKDADKARKTQGVIEIQDQVVLVIS